jgi:GntR family transcriptional regulator / MocR family aminotransferase
MAVEWAGLGPELLVALDRRRAEPLRAQLEATLREAIRGGRLQVGERLPSSRTMARELGVSRGLVQDCYAQLQAEGYLSSQTGSATRVAGCGHSAAPAPEPAPAAPRLKIDFRPGVPDLSSFPRTDWLWAMRETLRDMPNADFDYGNPRGASRLRTVLAAYLRRVRSAAAEPEHTVICGGFAQGLDLVLRVLAAGGVQRVAFEDPGYGDADMSEVCAHVGVQVVPVPVDERGIDVDALAASGARAVVLTPAHQSPTGVVLAPERRQALVAWADEHDAMIMEDDYDAEFRYDRDPVGALQGLAPDRVVSIGTVSKSLAPTVRLGWLLCPASLVDAVAAEKAASDRGSPGLDQLAFATLIESGRYDRHLRRMRAIYARRREVLVESLAGHAPDVRLTGLAAGFHAVAHLPDTADEQAVVAAARARSIGLRGMSVNRAGGGTTPPQLVIGFGNVNERALAEGIAAIADLLQGTMNP